MHGQGTLTYPDGLFYEGQLREDQMQGEGVSFNSRDSSRYTGQWVNNSTKVNAFMATRQAKARVSGRTCLPLPAAARSTAKVSRNGPADPAIEGFICVATFMGREDFPIQMLAAPGGNFARTMWKAKAPWQDVFSWELPQSYSASLANILQVRWKPCWNVCFRGNF